MKLDLSNETIRVGFINSMPYTRIVETTVAGIEAKMLLFLAECFNFSLIFTDFHGNYGDLSDGLMGNVSNEIMDIGIGELLIAFERLKFVRFFYPHWIDQLSFGTSLPPIRMEYGTLLRPMTWDIWLCLVIGLLSLLAVNQFEYRLDLYPTKSTSDSFWICIGSFFRQPCQQLNNMSRSAKACLLPWIFATLILTTIYSGFLYSIMAVPQSNPIDSISKLNYACSTGQIIPLSLSNFNFIRTMNDKTVSEIFRSLRIVKTVEFAVQMISKSNAADQTKYAVISPRESLKLRQMAVGSESLYIPQDKPEANFLPLLIGIATKPSFSYQKQFEEKIAMLHAIGLTNYWRGEEAFWARKLHPPHGDRSEIMEGHEDIEEAVQFTLEHFSIIFFLYLFGLIASVTVFVLEYFIFNRIQ